MTIAELIAVLGKFAPNEVVKVHDDGLIEDIGSATLVDASPDGDGYVLLLSVFLSGQPEQP